MSQKRVIVTIERPEGHDNQLQQTLDISAAIAAGATGISTVAMDASQVLAQAAQTAVSTHGSGTAQARDDAFTAMFIEQDHVKSDLQKKVDALAGSIDAKVALALANGFHVQDFGTINKQDFVVVDGTETGDAKLVAKGIQERSFHEWGDSIDKGATYRYVEPSLQATKVIKGYIPGEEVYFRHRMFTKDGPGPWHYTKLIIR